MVHMSLDNNSEKKLLFFSKFTDFNKGVAKSHVKSCRPPASLSLKIQCGGLNLILNGLRDYWITGRWLIIHKSVS